MARRVGRPPTLPVLVGEDTASEYQLEGTVVMCGVSEYENMCCERTPPGGAVASGVEFTLVSSRYSRFLTRSKLFTAAHP